MARGRKLHDAYFHQAKREGYLARSAYKLLEINERKKLIRKGDRVLDVGCAPGSWMQVCERIAGPKGRVVGLDLKEVRDMFGPTVTTIVADMNEIDPRELTALAGGKFDVVVSDMAPNTTGAGDDFVSIRLCRMLVDQLPGLLRKGGNFTMKVLEGAEFPELTRECKDLFAEARPLKPKASREVSRETFIIAKGYKGPPREASDAEGSESESAS